MATRIVNRMAGVWFPLSLFVLLLLAVPGFVLLALHLLDRTGAVNGWLQDQLGLTYHLPLPWWAALTLFTVPFLVILLYFLKLKRKPLHVPSTFLWKKSISDLHVNSLFQWLRDNVLLLVQLLILLILIYALMAFQVHGKAGAGRHYILLVDNSASMSVSDVEPNRLEAAKREALREIDAHTDDDTGMVIEFNSRASILQPYTNDRGVLRKAVQSIGPTLRRTDVTEALNLADSLANPQKSTLNQAVRPEGEDPAKARTYVDVQVEAIAAEVHLFSDGRFPDVPGFTAGNLGLNYHQVGKPGPESVDNIGIVALNAVRDESGTGRVQVFARVLNFRPTAADVRVELEIRVEGELKDIQRELLTLPARKVRPADQPKDEGDTTPDDQPGEGAATFDLSGLDDSSRVELHARLLDVTDSFPLDDEAWLVVGVIRKARVLIVTDGNEILSDFFDQEATRKVADVRYLKPADLKDETKYLRPAADGAFDLVVFDRCAPADEASLPAGNTFFVGDVPPPWKRSAMEPLQNAAIRNPASTHPLMRHLTALDEIAVSETFRFDLRDERVPPRTPRLLEADRENALLFALPRRSFTDLVMTFPLVNAKGEWTTTWNLKLSFPVFLRNVLYILGNVSDATAEENVQPGDVKALRPDVVVKRVEVTDPGGATEMLERSVQADFLYKNTECVGVYRARWEGGGRSFAVNLLDADESNVQPRNAVRLGSQDIPAGRERGWSADTWKWGVLAALILLLTEWAFYHRRIFV
jgi:von Willebrand factor type A domain/Aerotolerance regulator N-terminal